MVYIFKICTELPFQAETYQGEITNDTHGTEGPIKVSFAREYNNVGINFLEVAGAYDKERSLTDDVNAFTSCNQYGVSHTLFCRGLHTAYKSLLRWARYVLRTSHSFLSATNQG